MPDLAIYQLPPVTAVQASDQFPLDPASGPPTSSCTKKQLLTGGVGESQVVAGVNGGQLSIDVGGNVALTPAAGGLAGLASGAFNFLMTDTGIVNALIASVFIQNINLAIIRDDPVRPMYWVSYVPANGLDWSGPPAWHFEAIDRLAAAVAGLLGHPIP